MSKSLTNKKKSKTKKALDPKALGRDLTPFEEYRLSLEQDNNVNIGADGMWKSMVEESKTETQANFGKNVGFSQKMGAASSIIGGVGEIAQATAANAKVKDTTEDVNNINQFGNTVYNATDYADAAAQFNNRGELKEYSKNDLTGSAGEKAKNVGKATLSGAKAGAAFGPIGMIIGGAVGAISSGIGAAVGNNKAKKEAERLNHMSMMADLRNTSNFDINTDNIAYQNNMMDMANYAAYGGLFNKFNGGGPTNNQMATIDDVINTESSFDEKEKITTPFSSNYTGLINPYTGGYANLNTQKYENLKEGTEEYKTPYFIYHGKKKDPNLEDVDSSYEFLYNWYTNSKRQAIKEQNDLEVLLIQRDAWNRRHQFYDSAVSEKTSKGDMDFIRDYKKKRNTAKRRVKSLNKEIETYLTNPEKTAEKTKEGLDSDLERVINLPVSMYDPESMESSIYYNPNNWADTDYIENEDKEMYTPKIVEEYTDDGKKKAYKVTTNAYYSPNKNKTKRYLSFNKNRAFRSNDISSAGEEAQHAMELKSSEWIARNIVNDITKYYPDYIFDEYYDSPEEIVGKLGNLRRELNIDPNKEWSLKEIEEIKKNYTGRNHILKNYPPEIILELFNRVANNSPSNLDIEIPEQLQGINPDEDVYMAAYGGPIKSEFKSKTWTESSNKDDVFRQLSTHTMENGLPFYQILEKNNRGETTRAYIQNPDGSFTSEQQGLTYKLGDNPTINTFEYPSMPAELKEYLDRANIKAAGGPLFNEFSNDVTIINEGGTHEENIHGGVPVGVDDKGVPNLVEEDEVIWNNYVFSNRLKPMKSVRTKYKLGGSKDLTFADAAKDISKMSEEMPNDPIVRRTRDLRLNQLMQEQEVIRMQKNKTNNPIGFAAFGGNMFNNGGNWRNRTSKKGYYNESTGRYDAPATKEALNALYNKWYTDDPEGFEAFRTSLRPYADSDNWKAFNEAINNHEIYGAMNRDILGWNSAVSHIHGPSTAARLGILNWTPPSTETVVAQEEPVVQPEPVVNQEPEGPAVTPEEETSAPGDTSDGDKPKLGLDKILNAANVGFDVVSGYLDRFLTKPDYSHYDSFRDAINRANVRVAADPVVSNLRYKPFDTQSIYNRMQANNAANARNIMNTSGGNSAIARASLLTNDNNFNNSLGNLWRQVEEGEYARRMNYDKYMTDIAAGNSARKMQADSTNANIAANQAGLWKQYADARQNIDNLTSAALSTNYNTAKQSLQGYAQQLWAENNIDNAIKNGYLIDNATGRRYNVSAETPATPKPVEEGTRAYGGKIKRTNKKKRRLS